MKTLFQFLRNHLFFVGTCIAIALLHGSPHLVIPRTLDAEQGDGATYAPITIESNFDEATVYGPRARKAYEGEIFGDVVVAEHSGEPMVLPLLNPLSTAALAVIAGSFSGGVVLGDFLIPPIIFCIVYLLLLALSQSRVIALLFATYFILSPQGVLLIPPTSYAALSTFLQTLFPFFGPGEPLFFSRIEYPQVTFVWYALTMWLLYAALSRGGQRYVIGAGVAFGLTFYSYLYDWAYTCVGLGIILFIFLLRKEYIQVRRIVSILGIGFAMSFAYWVNLMSVHALPHYADVMARMGVEISNEFRVSILLSYVRSVALVVVLWLMAKKKSTYTLPSIYVSGFLLASLVVYNAQVIVGFNPQPDHWYRLQFLPVLMTFVLIFTYGIREYIHSCQWNICLAVCSGVLVMVLIGGTAYTLYVSSARSAAQYTLPESSLESYRWLTEHTPRGAVVGTLSPKVNSELLLYTHNRLFLPNGLLTSASGEELWQRLYYMLAVIGYGSEDVADLLRSTPADDADNIMLYVFQNAYNATHLDAYLTNPRRIFPESELRRRVAEYELYYLDHKTRGVPRYAIDFLYIVTPEVGVAPDSIDGFEEVYATGTIRILKRVQ